MVGTRLYTVGAFVVQILAILPFAWLLTRVYQAELPFEEISLLNTKELEFSLGVHLVLQDDVQKSCSFEGTVDEVSTSFLSLLPPQVRGSVSVSASLGQNDTLTQRSTIPLTAFDDTLNASTRHIGKYVFHVLCRDGVDAGTLVMGKYRHGWVGTNSAAELRKALIPIAQLAQLQLGADVENRRKGGEKARKKQQLAYRLSFSLLNQDPSHPSRTAIHWDFSNLQKGFLDSFFEYAQTSSSIAMSVDSQVVHYATMLSKRVQLDEAKGCHFISREDLSDLMGSVDWHEGEGGVVDVASAGGANSSRGDNHNTDMEAAVGTGGSYSREQKVRFMFFVPSPEHTPLYIRSSNAGGVHEDDAEVFEVPGWGLVAVVNLADSDTETNLTDGNGGGASGDGVSGDGASGLHHRHFATGMGHVVMYCREMLGLKYDLSESTVRMEKDADDQAARDKALPLSIVAPAEAEKLRAVGGSGDGHDSKTRMLLLPCTVRGLCAWELELVARLQARQHLQAAEDALQALTQLAHSMPHMTVTEEVGDLVRNSLRSYHEAQRMIESGVVDMAGAPTGRQCRESDSSADSTCTKLSPPPSLSLALSLARGSRQAAETAVSHPSMVPQLYFPPEHLMAVYLPLWAPLALPLLLGFTKELRRYKDKTKEKEQAMEAGGDTT
jgi:hypothetical protein